MKANGQYKANRATGYWEYFYENGKPRMRGPLEENRNAGRWEYFYENGQLQMVGEVYDSLRQGPWRFYYENGQLKQEGAFEAGQRLGAWNEYYEGGALQSRAVHQEDTMHYESFYLNGALQLRGVKVRGRNEGLWKRYYDTGAVQAEGAYRQGTRHGLWKFYYPNGKRSSVGDFLDGSSVGKWTYYYQNGEVSAEGAERDGVKEGYWKLYHSNGDFKGETIFNQGDGTHREYYGDGSLKVQGRIMDGVNQDTWRYYYPDGTLEGKCVFEDGEGTYFGYYADGSLKMKGTVAQSKRTGVWELYEDDGTLAGYYQSVYENEQSRFEALEAYVNQEEAEPDSVGAQNPNYLFRKKKRLRYFESTINERRRFIVGVNPVALIGSRLSLGVEYYLQERLGYELEGGLLRSPFWERGEEVSPNTAYQRGFFVHLKQKFYHPDSWAGMFYFGHQLGFDYLYHYANMAPTSPRDLPPRLLAKEQRLSYALLVGTRLIKNGDLASNRIVRDRHARGLTFDLFGGVGVGYRLPHVRYEAGSPEATIIEEELKRPFVPFYFGVTVGYAF